MNSGLSEALQIVVCGIAVGAALMYAGGVDDARAAAGKDTREGESTRAAVDPAPLGRARCMHGASVGACGGCEAPGRIGSDAV